MPGDAGRRANDRSARAPRSSSLMRLPAGRLLQRLDRPLDATPHEAFLSIAEIEQAVDFAPPRRGHLAS